MKIKLEIEETACSINEIEEMRVRPNLKDRTEVQASASEKQNQHLHKRTSQ
jgi:hypothetical protein